ncbi:MAG: S9 family peptidase, partial [Chloroflexaceae bacterium]|nr:S9 family peptidase [Chloroflexaceae bacterium]
MRYSRWLVPLLLLPLLVSVASVQAAPDPARTDRGRSVIYVDGNGKDIPNLLSSAEVEKLLTLTTSEVPMALLSPVSPDDQALLAVNGGALGFLSVQNGSLVPVDVAAFDRIFPLALDGVGGWAWRDGRTLVSLGVELVDPDNFIVQTVLVTLDRATGAVGAEVLPDVPIDDVPISLSPNGSRLLLLRSALVGGPSEELFSARITSPQRSFQPKSHLPARVQQQLSTFRSKSPVVRRLLNYRPWRDTEGDSVAVIREELSLLLYDTRTGETSTLKTLAPGTQFLNDAWSQDSARIALSFSGVFDYIEDLNTPRRPFDGALLSEQAYQDVTANLDPRRNPFFQDNTVETFDLGTGETHVLRAADGDGAALIGVSWSTDGTTLATLAADPARLVGRRFPIYTLQFAERTSVRFYSFDLKLQRRLERPELAGSVFSTDATFVSPDELILRAPLADNYHPYYYNLRSGEFRTIADRAGGYYQVRPTRLSRQLVFTFTSYTNPPDFYRMRWDGGGLSRLSWSNEGLAQFSKTKQYPVSFRLASGETRSGTLILPADVPFPPRNLSIVVWQEGGPGGTMDNAWNTIIERPFGLLPNFGFGVLSVPLAGREGLSPAGYKKLYNGGNFGQADIDEQA